jgi:medium-chain acyl-[acyl-carrier-protein] hydrolase
MADHPEPNLNSDPETQMSCCTSRGETFSEALRIRSYDVDLTQRATLPAVCHYFLEAAWNHAEILGVGFDRLTKEGLFWVLSRLLIEVERFPQWGDAVTLNTWPRATKSVFALRDFELCASGGSRLVAGSSAWLVLDSIRRRPQRLERLLAPIKAFQDQTATERDPEKLPPCRGLVSTKPIEIRYGDIDVNGHVNSAKYVTWILDSYPVDFHRTHSIVSIEINYLGETLAGDTLTVNSLELSPGQYSHSLQRAGAEEACRARLNWRQEANPAARR